MNGRIYDPRLGRFLSPDPYVQAPGYTQSYNRYSYCWNNPMKFVDPDGYIITGNPNRGPSGPTIDRPDSSTGYAGGFDLTNAGKMLANGFFNPNWFYAVSSFGGPLYGGLYYDWGTGTYHGGDGQLLNWMEAHNIITPYAETYAWNKHAGDEVSRTTDGNIITIYYSGAWLKVGNAIQRGAGVAQDGGGGNGDLWATAGVITGALLADDVTVVGAVDNVAIPFVWYTVGSIAAYRYMTKTTAQYVLTARTAGRYPVYVWGFSNPVSYVDLEAGDVWKYGITCQYIPGTDTQWRYSQSQLDAWNVNWSRQYEGPRTGALYQENVRLTTYYEIYGTLPPGNKIFR